MTSRPMAKPPCPQTHPRGNVVKPFSPQELVSQVRAVLARSFKAALPHIFDQLSRAEKSAAATRLVREGAWPLPGALWKVMGAGPGQKVAWARRPASRSPCPWPAAPGIQHPLRRYRVAD